MEQSVSIKIRELSLEDVNALQDISIHTFVDTYGHENTPENLARHLENSFNIEKLTAEIQNPETKYYFAENESKVIGYLKLNWGPTQTGNYFNNAIEIERIYLLPEFKGMGLGSYLFNKSLEFARKNKFDHLWLGVWEKNPSAIQFYKKMGCEPYGTHSFVLGDDPQTDMVMHIDLLKSF